MTGDEGDDRLNTNQAGAKVCAFDQFIDEATGTGTAVPVEFY